LTQSEVENYVKKFGSGGKLNMAQFRELMVHLIGVIHTKESIVASFQYIGRDDDEVGLQRFCVLLGFFDVCMCM
jgi:Ca2+-binding EF-hand superfamily protein